MANEKEIRLKIASVQNTGKITKAMEMVAASKMRRAQDQMYAARPYSEKLSEVVQHLATSSLKYRHPWLLEREKVRNVGFIIVSTDRGLCGGLNTNVFKLASKEISRWSGQKVDAKLCVFGKKGISFFKRLFSMVATARNLGDRPAMKDLIGPIRVMLDAFNSQETDRLFLVENGFVNTMSQTPRIRQLLPIPQPVRSEAEESGKSWDYIYEPDNKGLPDIVLGRYVEALVYQAIVENVACEMAARMVAMKSASDNASEMVDELRLAYNKARQMSITQEISEIVGGAAAV